MNKYYLRILENGFTFLLKGFHEEKDFLESDIPIKEEEYLRWNNECSYKRFRIKDNPTGTSLFDYIEEYIPEPLPPAPPSETELLKQRIELLENENADLLLDSVNKDMRIEQNETDIADLLLVVGGM